MRTLKKALPGPRGQTCQTGCGASATHGARWRFAPAHARSVAPAVAAVTARPVARRAALHGLAPNAHIPAHQCAVAPPLVAPAGSEATKGRTSLTCHLAKTVKPCPILLQKIHMLTGKPFGHMELPQVARYTDSQRYVEHYDGVDPHTEAGRAFCQNGGQRIATVLVYLNHVAEGGSTFFRCAEES